MFKLLVLLLLVVESPSAQAAETKAVECPMDDSAETTPAAVDMKVVLTDVLALKDIKGRAVVQKMSPELEKNLRAIFEADPKKISKLEQYYALLFFVAKYRTLPEREIVFDPKSTVSLMLSSKVFSTPDIPNHIAGVTLNYEPHREKASYDVRFDMKEVRVPLNQGKGFSNFREGLCQTAKDLVFYGGFQFDVHLTVNNSHVFVSNFKNVDLFGTFGARGVVNVDIEYVSLKSVEFLSGSPMGVVRAKVSKKEFEVNKHSFLLKLVTSLVTDKSTQAIDW